MANRHIATELEDADPAERTGTRIRALLARTRPLTGNEVSEQYWDGRQLIEQLALAFDMNDEMFHWTPSQCADVLTWLGTIEPVSNTCFCNDPSRVNATCGLHAVLNFMSEEMERFTVKRFARLQAA